MDAEFAKLVREFGGGIIGHTLAHYIAELPAATWDEIISGLNTLAVAAEGRNADDFSKALVQLALKFV